MAHTFLVFDFGKNEDAAQQARHRMEGWKQVFHLGDKILLKFDRKAEDGKDGGKKKEAGEDGAIEIFVRLAFSDHEKLSHQRWLDRIPTEEPFKKMKSRVVKSGQSEFEAIRERFESLP